MIAVLDRHFWNPGIRPDCALIYFFFWGGGGGGGGVTGVHKKGTASFQREKWLHKEMLAAKQPTINSNLSFDLQFGSH